MILYLAPGGRLGNQLFQAAFIERIRKPRERVFCTKMSEALRFARGLRGYVNTDSFLFIKAMEYLVEPLIKRFLVDTGLVSSYIETDTAQVVERRGLLPVTYLKGYFQQCDVLVPGAPLGFRLPLGRFGAARRVLEAADGRTPIFVHVRRGDYLGYSEAYPMNPLLPAAYYHDALATVLRSVPEPHVFFLGDDPVWCAHEFPDLKHATISRGSEAEDLALMALCAGGVISNSSFAWWGAYLCGKTAPVVAPRYWLGWRSKLWSPGRIRSNFITYIDVRP